MNSDSVTLVAVLYLNRNWGLATQETEKEAVWNTETIQYLHDDACVFLKTSQVLWKLTICEL